MSTKATRGRAYFATPAAAAQFRARIDQIDEGGSPKYITLRTDLYTGGHVVQWVPRNV